MPNAYYSAKSDCWYVPVSPQMYRDFVSIEPVRLELKDGQLVVTLLGDNRNGTPRPDDG